MDSIYLIVPAACALIFGLLIFLLVHFKKTGRKFRFIVTIPVTIAFLLIGGFLSWRFTEIALYPKITINGQAFVFEGHRYLPDNSYDPDDIPYGHLTLVAFERSKGIPEAQNLLSYIFFPCGVYVQDNDPARRTIWERGLMFDAKFVRAS
jgi:hypothetical protein